MSFPADDRSELSGMRNDPGSESAMQWRHPDQFLLASDVYPFADNSGCSEWSVFQKSMAKHQNSDVDSGRHDDRLLDIPSAVCISRNSTGMDSAQCSRSAVCCLWESAVIFTHSVYDVYTKIDVFHLDDYNHNN